MTEISFSDIAVVSCGTMSLELNYLKAEGFLDTEHLYYTTPGLHQDIPELERQLLKRINKAREKVDKVLVVYGGKFCYQATQCMDMLASEEEKGKIAQELAGGEPVWWMTPGWVKFREQVFKGWDKGVANENFPRHTGGAIVLDGIGYLDQYMAEKPEDFLEYCDWMGIPMQAYPVTLVRFKSLLAEQAEKLLS